VHALTLGIRALIPLVNKPLDSSTPTLSRTNKFNIFNKLIEHQGLQCHAEIMFVGGVTRWMRSVGEW
ncbi:hypothetical protein, partial [Aeromonas caviae]|uniref:hypothetical protein n=1 Tax=Aeromonas caviae TaxID=648 RepID=UPI001F2F902C